jgi:hypothetical protein
VYEIKGPMFFEVTVVSLLCTVHFDTILQRINRRRKFMVTLLAQCAMSHKTDFLMTALEEVFNEQLIEQFAKSGLQI